MVVACASLQEPPYIPSQTLVRGQGGVSGQGGPGNTSGHLCSGLGRGRGLFCLAVGWVAGFLDMGLIQGDHLHSLQQHPLPEKTQEGSLEKHECDN